MSLSMEPMHRSGTRSSKVPTPSPTLEERRSHSGSSAAFLPALPVHPAAGTLSLSPDGQPAGPATSTSTGTSWSSSSDTADGEPHPGAAAAEGGRRRLTAQHPLPTKEERAAAPQAPEAKPALRRLADTQPGQRPALGRPTEAQPGQGSPRRRRMEPQSAQGSIPPRPMAALSAQGPALGRPTDTQSGQGSTVGKPSDARSGQGSTPRKPTDAPSGQGSTVGKLSEARSGQGSTPRKPADATSGQGSMVGKPTEAHSGQGSTPRKPTQAQSGQGSMVGKPTEAHSGQGSTPRKPTQAQSGQGSTPLPNEISTAQSTSVEPDASLRHIQPAVEPEVTAADSPPPANLHQPISSHSAPTMLDGDKPAPLLATVYPPRASPLADLWKTPFWIIDDFQAPCQPGHHGDKEDKAASPQAEAGPGPPPTAEPGFQVTQQPPYFDLEPEDLAGFRAFQSNAEPCVRDSELMDVPDEDLEFWGKFYFAGVDTARELLRQRRRLRK